MSAKQVTHMQKVKIIQNFLQKLTYIFEIKNLLIKMLKYFIY